MSNETELDKEDIAIIDQLTAGRSEYSSEYVRKDMSSVLPILRKQEIGGIDELVKLCGDLYGVATTLFDKADAPKRALLFDLINKSPIWDTVLTTSSMSKYYICNGLGQMRWKTKDPGWELQPLTSAIGYVNNKDIAHNFGLVHTAFAENPEFKQMSLEGVSMRLVGGNRYDAQWVDVAINGISKQPQIGLIPLEYMSAMTHMQIDFESVGLDNILKYRIHRHNGLLVMPSDHHSSGVIANIENRKLLR